MSNGISEEFVQETIEVWKAFGTTLSPAQARQAIQHISEFFKLLRQWTENPPDPVTGQDRGDGPGVDLEMNPFARGAGTTPESEGGLPERG